MTGRAVTRHAQDAGLTPEQISSAVIGCIGRHGGTPQQTKAIEEAVGRGDARAVDDILKGLGVGAWERPLGRAAVTAAIGAMNAGREVEHRATHGASAGELEEATSRLASAFRHLAGATGSEHPAAAAMGQAAREATGLAWLIETIRFANPSGGWHVPHGPITIVDATPPGSGRMAGPDGGDPWPMHPAPTRPIGPQTAIAPSGPATTTTTSGPGTPGAGPQTGIAPIGPTTTTTTSGGPGPDGRGGSPPPSNPPGPVQQPGSSPSGPSTTPSGPGPDRRGGSPPPSNPPPPGSPGPVQQPGGSPSGPSTTPSGPGPDGRGGSPPPSNPPPPGSPGPVQQPGGSPSGPSTTPSGPGPDGRGGSPPPSNPPPPGNLGPVQQPGSSPSGPSTTPSGPGPDGRGGSPPPSNPPPPGSPGPVQQPGSSPSGPTIVSITSNVTTNNRPDNSTNVTIIDNSDNRTNTNTTNINSIFPPPPVRPLSLGSLLALAPTVLLLGRPRSGALLPPRGPAFLPSRAMGPGIGYGAPPPLRVYSGMPSDVGIPVMSGHPVASAPASTQMQGEGILLMAGKDLGALGELQPQRHPLRDAARLPPEAR